MFSEFIYSTVLRLATPVYLLRLWWRGRQEPLYRHAMLQRMGWRYPAQQPKSSESLRIWIHAVSLGETRAASALINALRVHDPGVQLILTHSTATGWEAGQALITVRDRQTWFPYDTPGAVESFLEHWRPDIGVMMETEVWPNVLRIAEHHHIPVVLANARLSDKSLRQGQRYGSLLRQAASRLTCVLAQSQADAQRIHQMGAANVEVMGNLKFDMSANPEHLARGRGWAAQAGRPVLMAASTREGEELLLLQAWTALTPAVRAQVQLLIVPRHPQRFDEIATMIVQHGLSLSRRSEWNAHGPLQADVWLGDSVGEMPAYYACAQVALLGGSFLPFGAQNLIEAAACDCPVVMGPSTFNFAQAAQQALEAGAAVQTEHIQAGLDEALRISLDPACHSNMVQRAQQFSQANRGSASRQARAILALAVAKKEAR